MHCMDFNSLRILKNLTVTTLPLKEKTLKVTDELSEIYCHEDTNFTNNWLYSQIQKSYCVTQIFFNICIDYLESLQDDSENVRSLKHGQFLLGFLIRLASAKKHARNIEHIKFTNKLIDQSSFNHLNIHVSDY